MYSQLNAKKIINNQIIEWLCDSSVIGYVEKDKINSLNPISNGKFFFKDMCVCRYFLEVAGASQNQMRSVLDENFRYINLRI